MRHLCHRWICFDNFTGWKRQNKSCRSIMLFPSVIVHWYWANQSSSRVAVRVPSFKPQCNKLYFVPPQSWTLWPLLYSWCVTPFVSVECGHSIGLVLFLVFVSEVLVSSAIHNPEYRSIQIRLWRSQLTIDDATFVLVEGREAWLFSLQLLWFLMTLSFLFELEQTTFFLTVGSYVVSGTQTSGWIFFVL